MVTNINSFSFISLIVTFIILAAVVIGIIETLRDKQEEFNDPYNLPLIPPTQQVSLQVYLQANPLQDQLWEVLYLLGNTKIDGANYHLSMCDIQLEPGRPRQTRPG
ncbi:hypothetical protein C8J56DRAFT_890085 [Mycena floridula]|nr:hypothetical protein C8J56DRAFT_890085 [Mycena floridula]